MERLRARLYPYLEALETYQFLTIQQFIKLGLVAGYKPAGAYVEVCRRLSEARQTKKPLIGEIGSDFIPRYGKLPKLFYLKPAGVQYLAEVYGCPPEEVHAPKARNAVVSRDIVHRIATIDLHIAVRLFCEMYGGERTGYSVDFFSTYFEGTGANRTSEETGEPFTKLSKVQITNDPRDYFIPDALFGVRLPKREQPYLFALEVYRGKDTKRVIKQLEKHVRAIEHGSIGEKVGISLNHRVLLVFEDDAAMEAFIQRIKRENVLYGVEEYFAFNTLERASDGFIWNWRRLGDEKPLKILL